MLTKGELLRANFEGAILTGADLTKAEMSRASLEGANAVGADFSIANISRVIFQDANLEGANFTLAYTLLTRFEGVDLSQTEGLTQDQLDIACGDEDTLLPDGLSASDAWPCDFE